jgi:hypothetical protein
MKYELLKKLTAPAKYAIENMPGSAFVQGLMPIVNFPAQILGSTAYGVGKQIADPENADFNKDTTEAMRATYYTPPSKAGREYQEALMNAIEASKLPPYIGRQAPMRLRPDDVRVMAKRGIETGREIAAIPEDFRAAQSGATRLNYKDEPTYGARLQGSAEDIGDALARIEARKSEYATPMTGSVQVFSDMVPDTKMYAVRPTGSQSQVIREVPTELNPRYNVTSESQLTSELERTLNRAEPTKDLEIRTREQPFTNFVPDNFGKSANDLFKEFIMPKLATEFPGLENEDLLRAAQVKYGAGLNTWMKSQLEEFARLPETQAYNVAAMATVENNPDRFENRLNTLHDVLVVPPSVKLQGMQAGDSWIMRNLQNYFVEHAGTPTDPMFNQILQTGKTPIPLNELEEYASDNARTATSFRNRVGMPTEGIMRPKLVEKAPELRNVEAQLEQLQTEFNNLVNANPGVPPPQIPGIKALYKQKKDLTKVKDKLVEQVDNIEKAIMYEDYMDAKVRPIKESSFIEDLNPTFAQRFPMIPTNKEYMYQIDMPEAFQELGADVVRELELGLITPEAAKSLSVPSAAKMKAELQAQREKALAIAEKANVEQLKTHILQETQSLPQDGAYGKGIVVKFDNSLSRDQMERALSSETEWMDHCIGRGGSPDNRALSRKAKALGVSNVARDDKYLGYVPMLAAHKSGRVVPKGSAGTATTYMNDFLRGESEGRSFRDEATGVPFATMKLTKVKEGNDAGKYRMGEFYGYKDRAVDGPWYEGKEGPYTADEKKEYRQVIADWANDHADMLLPVNSESLYKFANIYDAKSSDHKRALSNFLGVNESELNSVIQEAGKRFVTADEAKAAKQALQSQVSPMNEIDALTETQKDIERALRYGHYADDEEESLLRSQLRDIRDEIRQAEDRQLTVPGMTNAFNEYMSWLNDRHPTIQSRLDQIGDDISDINRGHMTAGQFGLNPQEFEEFERALGREQRSLIAQRNAGIQQQAPAAQIPEQLYDLLAPRDIADRVSAPAHQSLTQRQAQIEALTQGINREIRNLPTTNDGARLQQAIEFYEDPNNLPNAITDHTHRYEDAEMIAEQIRAHAQNRLVLAPAPQLIQAEPNAAQRMTLQAAQNEAFGVLEGRLNQDARDLVERVAFDSGNDLGAIQANVMTQAIRIMNNQAYTHLNQEDRTALSAALSSFAREIAPVEGMAIEDMQNADLERLRGNTAQNLINQYPERNQIQALINDLEHGAWDELPILVRQDMDEYSADNFVSQLIGDLIEYRDGLRAPQLPVPARQTAITMDDAIEALDEGLSVIEREFGDNVLDYASTQLESINEHFSPTQDIEAYIEELRRRAGTVRGNNRTALNILADELEGLHMRDWAPEAPPQLPPPEGFKAGGSVRKMNEGGSVLPEDIRRALTEGRITQNQAEYINNARLNPVPAHWGDHMSYQDRYNESLEPKPKYVPPTAQEVRLKAFLDKQDPMRQPNVDMNREQLKKHALQSENPATFKASPARGGSGGGTGGGADLKQLMNPRAYAKGGSIQSSKNRLLSPNTDEMRLALLKGK